jgi:hypothetical protein
LALTGCVYEVKEETPLPWFKIKKTLQGTSLFHSVTEQWQYSVKHDGSWTELDVSGASVLDSEHLLVFGARGIEIIHKDQRTRTYICHFSVGHAIPPCGGVIDLVEPIDTPTNLRIVHDSSAWRVVTQIRFKRMDFDGQVLVDKTISISESGRVFCGPVLVFCYDERNEPYFLAENLQAAQEWNHIPGDYALITVHDGQVETWAGPPEMTAFECHKLSNWKKIVPRQLQEDRFRADAIKREKEMEKEMEMSKRVVVF